MATKKTNLKKVSTIRQKQKFSSKQLIIFALAFAALGTYVVTRSFAASTLLTDVSFTAVDGTWPTAVLDDPMSVALGRYNSDYGYAGEKTYGPVMNLTGNASGLKTNVNADTTVICGQTEPVPHYEYDSSSGQWGLKDNGNTLMSLKVYRLINGANNAQLYVYGAQVSRIDRTKPMICYSEIYVTQKQGTKLTTAVPVSQKFTLQPK